MATTEWDLYNERAVPVDKGENSKSKNPPGSPHGSSRNYPAGHRTND